MSVIPISNQNFEAEVLSSEKPVLLDFYADWCGPCRMIAPILEEIAEERPDIRVGKINVDEENALAAQFGVSRIPFLVVIKDGKIQGSMEGFRGKEAVYALL